METQSLPEATQALWRMVEVHKYVDELERITDEDEYTEVIITKKLILEYRAQCVANEFKDAVKVGNKILEHLARVTAEYEKRQNDASPGFFARLWGGS